MKKNLKKQQQGKKRVENKLSSSPKESEKNKFPPADINDEYEKPVINPNKW
jgi:hypothetical protein